MKAASADLIALLAGSNRFDMWDVYTFTLVDGTVLTYSSRDASALPTRNNNIVLSLSFEQGTGNAGKTIKDSSVFAQICNTVTAVSSANLPLVQNGSLVITPGTYIDYPKTALFGFGRKPWTWEARIRVAAFVTSQGNCLFDFREHQHEDGAMFIRGTAPHTLIYWDGTTESPSGGAENIPLGVPVECCVSYDGETVRTFVDGRRIAEQVRALDFGTSNPLRIGANWENDPDSQSSMKVDEVRVTRGVCLYREDYDPSRGFFPRP